MKKVVALLIASCFLFSSCAGLLINPEALEAPKARAKFINTTYDLAFKDHQRFAALPNLRTEAKTLLNTKRTMLIHMNPFIATYNGYVETGVAPTDVMFDELLGYLANLESGWYTDTSQAKSFTIDPEITDAQLRRALTEAQILEKSTSAQMDPMFMGMLIELMRTGIHALRAMLAQRGLTEEQMSAAWQTSYDNFRTLDPHMLPILQ
jgi:hypothetical protein